MSKQHIEELISKLPSRPGVYKMKNEEGSILYVGKAKNLNKRVRSYFRKQKNRAKRTEKLIEQIADFEWIEVNSDLEAYMLETNLIKEYRPKYNVLMKDDKNFCYIKITKEDYPRIKVVRKRLKDGAKYIGPKTSAGQIKKTLKLLQKLFNYRSCDLGIEWKGEGKAKVTKKTIAYPCLDYHIKRCAGPCIGEITPEEYQSSIHAIEKFLKGDTKEIEADLKKKMGEFAANKEYERAAKMRDRLQAIQDMQGKQIVSNAEQEDMDVLAYALELNKAYFNLFQVRGGKLINQENFIADAPGFNTGEEDQSPEILASVLHQYYEKASDIPKKILIPIETEDEFIEDWLSNQRGAKVELITPQRGKKNQLIELSKENAKSFLKQHKARWAGFGEKEEESLEALAQAIELPKKPKRIECYDISHLGGTDTVASMVVFENGKAKNSDYRKFRIKSLEDGQIDDFQSMREVLTRRLRYLSKAPAGISIRKATKSKHKEIAALREEWHGNNEVPGKVEEYFVATHEKKVVGIIWLIEGKNNTHLLRSLYVTPEHRGKGIANALIKYAIEKNKSKRTYLSCFEELKDFYLDAGFETVKQMPEEFSELYLDSVRKKHPEKQIFICAYDPTKHHDSSFKSKPNLIVIDGGKGQLNAAIEKRDALGLESIPMIGLAKREEEIFIPGKSLPVLLPMDSGALKLIRRLRDEAHRFAITFQKKSRKKHLTQSKLDHIKGLGDVGKMKLLKKFGSVERIKKAPREKLEEIVGKKLAVKILTQL